MRMSIRAGSPLLWGFCTFLIALFESAISSYSPQTAMPPKPLPFSLEELRLQVDDLDKFVKSAMIATMKQELRPDEWQPSVAVDELAHLHGLLDLMRYCVEEIELCCE